MTSSPRTALPALLAAVAGAALLASFVPAARAGEVERGDLQKTLREILGLKALALDAGDVEERRLALQRILRVASEAEQAGGLRDAAAYVHWARVRMEKIEPPLRFGFKAGKAEAVMRAPREGELGESLKACPALLRVYFLQVRNLGERPLPLEDLNVTASIADGEQTVAAMLPDDPALPRTLADTTAALRKGSVEPGESVKGTVVFPEAAARPRKITLTTGEAFRVEVPFYENTDPEGHRRAREELLMHPDPPAGRNPGRTEGRENPDGQAATAPPEKPAAGEDKAVVGRVQNAHFAPNFIRISVQKDIHVREGDRFDIYDKDRQVGTVAVEHLFPTITEQGDYRFYIVKIADGSEFRETHTVRRAEKK